MLEYTDFVQNPTISLLLFYDLVILEANLPFPYLPTISQ
jgi:hypothetical protein